MTSLKQMSAGSSACSSTLSCCTGEGEGEDAGINLNLNLRGALRNLFCFVGLFSTVWFLLL